LLVEERRRPVGVIGANYEARPNVTIDVASQLIKSRNVGVLRTGGAALRSAVALLELVIAPALAMPGSMCARCNWCVLPIARERRRWSRSPG